MVAEMVRPASLSAEWKRIRAICRSEGGRQPETDPKLAQLRGEPASGAGSCCVRRANKEQPATGEPAGTGSGRTLAAIYAPAIQSECGAAVSDLQQSSAPSIQPWPFCIALLAFTDPGYALAEQLAQEQGELVGRGLALGEGEVAAAVQPHRSLTALLTGLPRRRFAVPARCRSIFRRSGMKADRSASAAHTYCRVHLLWISHAGQVVNEIRAAGRRRVRHFSRTSGTSETFAASVIIKQLGWDLYRVDLRGA